MLVSFVAERFEDGAWSGVPRFDYELRRVFPEMVSLRTTLLNRLKLWSWSFKYPDLTVIACNETSVLVPKHVRTIVVHHGCAQTHYDRDPEWRGPTPDWFCRAQRDMYHRPNRVYVAPAEWTAREFSKHYDVPLAKVIPHWVDPISREASSNEKPVIIGDWRNFNKGEPVISALKKYRPDLEFRALDFTYESRKPFYQAADAYLCLSLSEGGSYAMSDAESARLPIVSTDVGNCIEYKPTLISWERRDDISYVSDALDRALSQKKSTSFFDTWTFEKWSNAWHNVLKESRLAEIN